MTLEPNAFTAATRTGANLVVTAGPGSGKTEMLAQRADFLLRTGQSRYPHRLLAISFKADAAKNLTNRVRRRCSPQQAARLDSYTFHAFAKRLIDTFRPVLTGVDALDRDYEVGPSYLPPHQIDFQNMAPLATTILEQSAVARAALRHTYGFVFLDEFQDCTSNQYALLRAAFHGTGVQLIAVGDIKQRIMGWAGALEGVLARFADDFAAERLSLYLNHRSQPRLRRVQNAMVRQMEPADALDDGAIEGTGGVVEVLRYPDSATEARDLADRIQGWIVRDGVPAEEIAVLVANQVRPYTEALRAELRARRVPFRDETELQDLASEPVATLILDYLAVITEDGQPDAYARLVDVATGWHEDEEITRRAYSAIGQFLDKERAAYRAGSSGGLDASADRFLAQVGGDVLAGLGPQYQQGNRLQQVVDEVWQRLREILNQTNDVGLTLQEFAGSYAVKLMTVHKAKGLEFRSVVVLGVEHEMYFGGATAARSTYFVAVSRARQNLYLTTAARRPLPSAPVRRWDEERNPHSEFLGYASTS
ncbi:ATP-dependent helicase [Lentzea sp. NPDC003310]|uniref:ATP-dependent helicase n=1 Tax=Lentzea sp. NPDC003310 TaxID=3154447 RepID=UPI0033A6EBFB